MTIKNPTLRRRTKGLSECAEDARQSQLLGYELKDVGNLILTLTMHMNDLQNKVDSQAEHIKMLNKKLESTPTDIVHCEDCKNYDEGGFCWHPAAELGDTLATEPTDSCSYGEAKEEEG